MTGVVVAIPCFNEATTIAKVVADFRAALPEAAVCVFDNNSTDGSAALARSAGADVVPVRRQGKGYVMQAVLRYVDCDALVIVDADDTYPADEVSRLLAPIWTGEADMVIGTRLEPANLASMYRLNRLGNHLILGTLNVVFRTKFHDVLSGYRVLSRALIDQVLLITSGFETEVELTIQTMEHGLAILEVPVSYRQRPAGSWSKLRPFSDGYRILVTMAVLLRDHRPMMVFGSIGACCLLIAGAAGALRVLDYAGIRSLPVSLLSGVVMSMAILGILFGGLGLVLNSINTRFREMSHLLRRRR